MNQSGRKYNSCLSSNETYKFSKSKAISNGAHDDEWLNHKQARGSNTTVRNKMELCDLVMVRVQHVVQFESINTPTRASGRQSSGGVIVPKFLNESALGRIVSCE